jgi:hypothetical protein
MSAFYSSPGRWLARLTAMTLPLVRGSSCTVGSPLAPLALLPSIEPPVRDVHRGQACVVVWACSACPWLRNSRPRGALSSSLAESLSGFAGPLRTEAGTCGRYPRPWCRRPATRRDPELPPRFSRLKIVCGSFGTVPGLGRFVGFLAGVGESLRGWSAMAMSLAPRQARGQLSQVRASRARAQGRV